MSSLEAHGKGSPASDVLLHVRFDEQGERKHTAEEDTGGRKSKLLTPLTVTFVWLHDTMKTCIQAVTRNQEA